MTDFLTSLTARSFGTETAIRPRVASLFEPVRNGEAALREAPAVVEPIETEREVEVESDGERSMIRPAPVLEDDGKANDVKRSADENSVSAVLLPPQRDSERHRTTVLADETREKEDTVAVKVRPRRGLFSQEENANESERALRPDKEDGALKRVSTKAPAPSPTPVESLEREHRGLVLPPRVVTDLTPQMKDTALAMNVSPNARGREKAGSALSVPTTESEPSVQVTIGRIEVRATSESKQVSRPRPASPVMSLEEYLHRRTQRGGQ